MAAGGTAGLYRLAAGAEGLPTQPVATRLGKPAGTSYASVFAALARWTARPGVGLWQRQMTLGRTPEFCLLSHEAPDLDLPGLVAPLRATRRVVWPAPRL